MLFGDNLLVLGGVRLVTQSERKEEEDKELVPLAAPESDSKISDWGAEAAAEASCTTASPVLQAEP